MSLTTLLRRAALLVPAVVLLGACATAGGHAGWTFAPLGPTQPPTAEPSPSGSAPAGNVIELEATANLRFAGNQAVRAAEQLPLASLEGYKAAQSAHAVNAFGQHPKA